jgi:hypothetical protein
LGPTITQTGIVGKTGPRTIDNLAGQITGNPQYFWIGNASAGDNQIAFQQGIEKEVKRRRLMGVRIPVVAMRIVGCVA